MDAAHHRAELDRQWCAVQEWLTSGDARAAAAAELRGEQLVGLEPDDLLSDASLRLWGTFRNRTTPVDAGDDARGLIRYARRALHNAAIDAFRAAAHRSEHPSDDLLVLEREDPQPVAVPDLVPLTAVRQVLHATLDRAPSAGAAALIAAAVVGEALDLRDDVPQPARGATPVQAACWAGLWFTGGDDLFPTEDDPASRQRRSRAVRQAQARLRDALESTVRGGDRG